jgi:hypothetical protein
MLSYAQLVPNRIATQQLFRCATFRGRRKACRSHISLGHLLRRKLIFRTQRNRPSHSVGKFRVAENSKT